MQNGSNGSIQLNKKVGLEVVQRLVRYYRDEYFKARSVAEFNKRVEVELEKLRTKEHK